VRIAVALDGAGGHPAAWREPGGLARAGRASRWLVRRPLLGSGAALSATDQLQPRFACMVQEEATPY